MSYRLDSYLDRLFIIIFTLATIVILINPLFLIPLNIQKVFASGAQFLVKDANDKIDYISDLFVFGTGIFAAILFVLSLNAYTNLKTKRLLLVSIAFALFSVNVMLSRRIRSDNRIIDIRSDIGDLDFRERLKPKTTTDPSSPRF